MVKHSSVDFKWRHYEGEIILLCVRWYLRYRLSYRDLVEMIQERGLHIAHSTILRWVQHYAPEIQKRVTHFLKKPNDSWRVDETYIKVKGEWMYLYRAVDSEGQTIDFYLSRTRSKKAAKRFLGKLIRLPRTEDPRVITTDKNPAYPPALAELKEEGKFKKTEQRCSKYMNNLIEQDHRRVKWQNRHAMGYWSYKTAYRTIRGIETMHMLFKKQLYHLFDQGARSIQRFIHLQFGLIAPIFEG